MNTPSKPLLRGMPMAEGQPMITTRVEKLADTGEQIEQFHITVTEGFAMGFYRPSIKTICIHHIANHAGQRHSIKAIMPELCRKYNTNKFRFLMVINAQLKNIVKGKVVIIPANDPSNPFGEDLEEIHGEWKHEMREM